MNKTKENIPEKIIELKLQDNFHSSFIDANGILKGECYINGEAMYEIYYNRFSCYVPINEYGYFYNKFSCKKYDRIIKLPICDLYFCEKNGRFGIINTDEECILHTTYNEIKICFEGRCYQGRYHYLSKDTFYSIWKEEYQKNIFFIVTTETGKFLYNLPKEMESFVYDDILLGHKHIIYKSGEKYGALDTEGKILLKPYYNKSNKSLTYKYQDSVFNVWAENGLFYGRIPISKYDVCIYVDSGDNNIGKFFISIKDNKYGLISEFGELVSEPVLDEIVLYHPQKYKFIKGSLYKLLISKPNCSFVIARIGDKYKLFNLQNGNTIINNCNNINYKYSDNENNSDIIEFIKEDISGYILWDESIISTTEYEDIFAVAGFIRVKKEGKFGIIKPSGDWYFPCIYDSIHISKWGVLTLIKDGKEEKIRNHSKVNTSYYYPNEETSYGKYSGSYAQDEMGYSDDDIDTIFDGDPSAYWNID